MVWNGVLREGVEKNQRKEWEIGVWVGVRSEQNQHPNEGNRLDRKLESSLFPYYLSVWHHFSNSCVRLGFGAYRSLLFSPPLASQKPIWGGALLIAIAPLFIKESRGEKKREVVGRMKENEKKYTRSYHANSMLDITKSHAESRFISLMRTQTYLVWGLH